MDAFYREARRMAGVRRARLRRAVPSARETAVGGLGWGLLMALCGILGAVSRGYLTPPSIMAVAATYFVGGALAWPAALFAFRLVARGTPRTSRFAASFVALTAGTAGLTALLYALWYRDYAADFADAAFSPGWLLAFVFTVAGNVYQFAVLGLRFYLPFGLLGALMAAFYLSRFRLR